MLAYVVRRELPTDRTKFVTDPDANLQVGFVVHAAGSAVMPHTHRPIERHVVGMSEMLLVQHGRCVVDLFNDARELVMSRELVAGDLIVMLGCGHGCRMLEDTVLLEVKQGPYEGPGDKVPF